MTLHLPLDTSDRIPKTFSVLIAQESDWAIPQCISYFKQFMCGFKSVLKILPDKRQCLLATMTDVEALTLICKINLWCCLLNLSEKRFERRTKL